MAISPPVPPPVREPAPTEPGEMRALATTAERSPQVTHRPAPRSRRESLESLVVFLVFGLAYFALGYHVITTNNVVVFDALDRVSRALTVWWNKPPKLAAVGFGFPPMQTLIFLPIALVKPLVSSLVALPLISAAFAGATMAVLARTLKRCGMSSLPTYGLLLVFAFNPLFAFYATNGLSDMAYLFFLASALYCLIAWSDEHATLYLIGAGTAMALGVLTGYGLLAFAALLALLFGATIGRHRPAHHEVEGSVIAYAMPIIYALMLWTLLNGVIVGDPFGWLGDQGTNLAVNSGGSVSPGALTLTDLASRVVSIVVGVAPLAIVAVPLLMVASFSRKDDLALWIAGLLALSIVLVGGEAVLAGDIGRVVLRNGLPVAVIALVGAGTIYRLGNGLRIPVFAAAAALLLLAIPLTWSRMRDYPYQNQEQAFTQALRTNDNLTGTSSIGGYTVGLASERAMAAFVKRTVGNDPHAILTDNAQTFPVIVLTGRPGIFRDRVQKGDKKFKQILANPFGEVRYMLIAAKAGTDIIRQRYPDAADGGSATFPAVFSTARYTIVRVPVVGPSSRKPRARNVKPQPRSPRFTPAQPAPTPGANSASATTATPIPQPTIIPRATTVPQPNASPTTTAP